MYFSLYPILPLFLFGLKRAVAEELLTEAGRLLLNGPSQQRKAFARKTLRGIFAHFTFEGLDWFASMLSLRTRALFFERFSFYFILPTDLRTVKWKCQNCAKGISGKKI